MAKGLIEDSSLTLIADAIRSKGGTSGTLEFPNGFKSAIQAIPTEGGGITPSGTITITQNGAYNVTNYAEAIVEVQNESGGEAKLDGAYVWQKYTVEGGEWEYTTESLGTTKPSDCVGTARSSFTITDDGYFELSTETATLGGYHSISGGDGKSIYASTWRYASSGSYYEYSKLTITNSTEEKKGSIVTCVTSDTENAYPDNGKQDGYWYVKLAAVSTE